MNMKGWIVKNITHRKIRDLHRIQIRIINEKNPYNVLDIAPPVTIDLGNYVSCKYTSLGLHGKRVDIKHDLNEYPYPAKDKSYDMVIMSNILEHLYKPILAISEGARIARKWLIIGLPTNCKIEPSRFGPGYGHKYRYRTYFTYDGRFAKFFTRGVRDFLSSCFEKKNIIVVVDMNRKGMS